MTSPPPFQKLKDPGSYGLEGVDFLDDYWFGLLIIGSRPYGGALTQIVVTSRVTNSEKSYLIHFLLDSDL